MGNLMIEHDVCHVSVFPSWFGIGWVVIALAECTTIRVICGIPWQVNPHGWPCQGASACYTADWDNFTGSNCIGSKLHWEQFQWEQISMGEITLEQNFARAAGNGQCTSQDTPPGCLAWRRRLPACLAASLVHSRTHGWRPSAARNRRYNCVEGAIGNSVAPLHRELAPRMVP